MKENRHAYKMCLQGGHLEAGREAGRAETGRVEYGEDAAAPSTLPQGPSFPQYFKVICWEDYEVKAQDDISVAFAHALSSAGQGTGFSRARPVLGSQGCWTVLTEGPTWPMRLNSPDTSQPSGATGAT